MKLFLIRCLLMQKRMFKKISYLVIMLPLPFLVLAMKNLSSANKEILTIAMVRGAGADELVRGITDRLTKSDGVLSYLVCDTREEAEKMLMDGDADVLWIFPDDLAERIREVAKEGYLKPVVSITWREKVVSLELTKEILCTQLYPTLAFEAYRMYLLKDLEIKGLSEEQIVDHFNRSLINNNLFEMDYLDGEMEKEDVGYLMAPVRGMMALWLILCGLASDMYFLTDEKKGVFSYVPLSKRWLMALGEQAVVMTDAFVILLVSLKISGVFVGFWREVLCLFLFTGCSLTFCTILRLLLKKVEWIGFLTPILMAGMLVLCPVFLRSSGLRAVKLLLPPYYYLNSIHNSLYIYGMLIYFAATAGALLVARARIHRC